VGKIILKKKNPALSYSGGIRYLDFTAYQNQLARVQVWRWWWCNGL